jgi:conjugative transfer signal peptidase TraF
MNLKLNLTHSLPIGIYKTIPVTPGTIFFIGDIVIFCPPIEIAKYAKERGYLDYGNCPGKVMPMQKVITALFGDTATIKNNALYINNQIFLIADIDNKLYYKGGKVQQGHFLALTNADYGFDSRYFGEIPLKNIIAKTSIVLKF